MGQNRSAIASRIKLEAYILNREYEYTTESYAHNKNIKVFELKSLLARVSGYSATPSGFCCDNLITCYIINIFYSI